MCTRSILVIKHERSPIYSLVSFFISSFPSKLKFMQLDLLLTNSATVISYLDTKRSMTLKIKSWSSYGVWDFTLSFIFCTWHDLLTRLVFNEIKPQKKPIRLIQKLHRAFTTLFRCLGRVFKFHPKKIPNILPKKSMHFLWTNWNWFQNLWLRKFAEESSLSSTTSTTSTGTVVCNLNALKPKNNQTHSVSQMSLESTGITTAAEKSNKCHLVTTSYTESGQKEHPKTSKNHGTKYGGDSSRRELAGWWSFSGGSDRKISGFKVLSNHALLL